jgi:hypothetical protein
VRLGVGGSSSFGIYTSEDDCSDCGLVGNFVDGIILDEIGFMVTANAGDTDASPERKMYWVIMRTGLLVTLCVVVLALVIFVVLQNAYVTKSRSFDVFAEQIETQIPGLQPSLSLLGDDVAISDKIAIGYVTDTEF